MRRGIAASFAALAVLAVSPVASAKDLSGRVGVGYTTLLSTSPVGSLSAASARFWVSEQVGLEADLGVNFTSPKTGDSTNNFGLGLLGLFSFVDEPNMKLYGDGGLTFGSVGVDAGMGKVDSKTAIGLTAGLGAEFFLVGLPNLGLTTQVGLQYTTVTDVGSVIAIGGSDFASVGIRYYFGGAKGNAK